MHRQLSVGILSAAMFVANLNVSTVRAEAPCAGELSAQARNAPAYCTLRSHGHTYAVRIENVQRELGGGYHATRVTRLASVPGQGDGFDCGDHSVSASIDLYTQSGMEPFDLPLPAACNQPIEIVSSVREPILAASCQVEAPCATAASH